MNEPILPESDEFSLSNLRRLKRQFDGTVTKRLVNECLRLKYQVGKLTAKLDKEQDLLEGVAIELLLSQKRVAELEDWIKKLGIPD